jgi:site-specific recombinase XerC
MRFATLAQVTVLADAIPRRYRALVLVAAYTGLRWGELAGLRAKRVDLLHRRITASCEPAGRSAWSPPIPCIRGSHRVQRVITSRTAPSAALLCRELFLPHLRVI